MAAAKTKQEPIMKANIDPRKVIQAFGGPRAVQKRLRKARISIAIRTIENWQSRGNMPANRIAQLAMCAYKDGTPFNLIDYVTTAK